MNTIMTTNVAINLYWFGRHLTRSEVTLLDVDTLFDVIIDSDKGVGKRYFEQLGVELEYTDAKSFLREAIVGEHHANLRDIVDYARENAIIARSHIPTDAFGEVMKLHELFHTRGKEIDFLFVDKALSLIDEIWGALACGLNQRLSDHFIQLGKLVEKADLNIRHERDDEVTLSLLDEIVTLQQRICKTEPMPINTKDVQANLSSINDLISQLVVE